MERNAGFDVPDDRDWLYGALAGAESTIVRPMRINLATGIIPQDQGIKHDPSTSMACGSYSTIHAINTNNLHDNGGKQRDAFEYWKSFLAKYFDIYIAEGVDPIKKGTNKQHQLQHAKFLQYITAYVRLYSVAEFEDNLARKRALQTGSLGIDWAATRKSKDKIAVMGSGAAHLFAIVGYDSERRLFICLNSTALSGYDGGFFYLRYEDIGCLYTVHALFDFDDQDVIDEALRQRELLEAEVAKYIALGKPLKARHKIGLRNRGLASSM